MTASEHDLKHGEESSGPSCKLCGEPKPLQRSHIIPRSYYRRLKKGSGGQLVKITNDEESLPVISNSDPKDRLLCQDCERFFDKYYEKLGTQLFKPRPSTVVMSDYIKIKKFKYREIFLYFVSILWRASSSRLPQYQGIDLGDFGENMRHCLRERSLSINSSVRLDHFLKICVIRVVDKSGTLPDGVIKKCLMDMNLERGNALHDGMMYFFMVDGFLVCYLLKVERDFELQKGVKYLSQLLDRSTIRIQKVDFRELRQLSEMFATASRKFLTTDP